jgi:hypothetical protein
MTGNMNSKKIAVILGLAGVLLIGAVSAAGNFGDPEQVGVNVTTLDATSITPNSATLRAKLTSLDSSYDGAVIFWNYTNKNTGEEYKGPAAFTNQTGETVNYSQEGLKPNKVYNFEAYVEPYEQGVTDSEINTADRILSRPTFDEPNAENTVSKFIKKIESSWTQKSLSDGESPEIKPYYLVSVKGAGGGGSNDWNYGEEGGESTFGPASAYGGNRGDQGSHSGADGDCGGYNSTDVQETIGIIEGTDCGGSSGGSGAETGGDGGNGGYVKALISNPDSNSITASVGNGGSGGGGASSGSDGSITVWIPP